MYVDKRGLISYINGGTEIVGRKGIRRFSVYPEPRRNNSRNGRDKSAETALRQVKDKNYTDCLQNYSGDILLIGINYDKDSKEHTCNIEKNRK